MSYDKEIEPIIVDGQEVEDFVEPDRDFNSDEQLAQDENDAIDQSNIIDNNDRELRHAKPQTANAYSEGPSEDDLPEEAL